MKEQFNVGDVIECTNSKGEVLTLIVSWTDGKMFCGLDTQGKTWSNRPCAGWKYSGIQFPELRTILNLMRMGEPV